MELLFLYANSVTDYKQIKANWIDTVYWNLVPREPDRVRVIGDYKIWWQPYTSVGPLATTYNDIKHVHFLNKNGKQSMLRVVCDRKSGEFKIGRGEVIQLLSYPSFEEFMKDISDDKKHIKKEWDRRRKIKRKQQIKSEAAERNIPEEQVIAERKGKRAKLQRKKRSAQQAERTNRILMLAPLLTELRDEIDVVLKNYNEGRGDVSNPQNHAVRLKRAISAVRRMK